jgi:hypothetical protein
MFVSGMERREGGSVKYEGERDGEGGVGFEEAGGN